MTQKNGKRYIICVKRELIGTNGQAIKWAYPRPQRPPNPQTGGVEKAPFKIAAKRLEIENVNRTRFIRYFLVLGV